MGFFDKILQGLGFEGAEEHPPKKPVQNSEKQEKVKGEYTLNATPEPQKIEQSANTYEFSPKTQAEVQMIVDFLKSGKSVQVDFSKFLGSSVFRAMDFVQGACYALEITPKKLAEKIFLLEINFDDFV